MAEKVIHFKGNATGYLHYLGCGLYLREHYNLENVKFSGCSSGAIISTIMSLEIDFAKAAIILFQVQPASNNQFAMVGNWKKRLRLYFEKIFPDEFDYETINNLRIGVQFLRGFQFIEKFHTKSDLINCLLASTHIPLIMNYKPFEKFRGRWCVDGDLLGSYEQNGEEGVFFQNYKMSFINSISKKNKNDYLTLIKEGYQAAANNTDLNSYLEKYKTNSYRDQPMIDLLKIINEKTILKNRLYSKLKKVK